MTTLREAAQQALEALKGFAYHGKAAGWPETITALRAALAEQDDDLTAAWMAGAAEERKRAEQAQAQPLAWRYKPMVGAPWSLSDDGYYVSCKRDQGYIVEPLYAAPQPLSGLDVERLLEDVIGSLPVARKLVRAVEAEVRKRMGAQR